MANDRMPRQAVKTFLSNRPMLFGMTAIDMAWASHLAVSAWLGYQAFHGNNPLAFTGLDAPAYKIGVVAIIEGARAVLSMANVWEEEINWVASTMLVGVLMTLGGADAGKINPTISINATGAGQQCTYHNPVLNRALTSSERTECDTHRANGTMSPAWARNCGCQG